MIDEQCGCGGDGAVLVRISPGELADRMTILEVKSGRLPDGAARERARCELEALRRAWDAVAPRAGTVGEMLAALRGVNSALWDVEDELRRCERAGDFGPTFVDRARSVYRHNDRRCELKAGINRLLDSPLIEEKHYAP